MPRRAIRRCIAEGATPVSAATAYAQRLFTIDLAAYHQPATMPHRRRLYHFAPQRRHRLAQLYTATGGASDFDSGVDAFSRLKMFLADDFIEFTMMPFSPPRRWPALPLHAGWSHCTII